MLTGSSSSKRDTFSNFAVQTFDTSKKDHVISSILGFYIVQRFRPLFHFRAEHEKDDPEGSGENKLVHASSRQMSPRLMGVLVAKCSVVQMLGLCYSNTHI